MADVDVRVKEVLTRAEADIAMLAGELATARDYIVANSLLRLAQSVSDLGNAWSARKSIPHTVSVPPAFRNVQHTINEQHLSSPVKARERKYPRFRKEADVLVKVGWSKSDNSTYEHRSPRSILDHLISAIKVKTKPNELFTTEQLMPLRADDGSELPSYQSYLCLGWLIDIGGVSKHGRQGYTVSSIDTIDDCVATSWEKLPTR